MLAWVAAATAIFYSLWSVALAALFEMRLRIPDDRVTGRVTLILPATGPLPGLEDLLHALSGQTLKPERMIVTIEAADDPAFARVITLAEHFPQFSIELVVAGLSSLRSQKCTNLLAALARLNAEDAYVVLLDADIRPQPWWLSALVAPLAAGRADIVSGYRWPVAAKLTLGSALVAGIDRAVAVLPRLPQTRALWGGSLAVTRQAWKFSIYRPRSGER
jgi:cellulose synthase/poly-beta-1,6-N-acetylglucosamine synthase-like glycosyltransferase